MRLSPNDFDALQDTMLEMYDYRDIRVFREAAPSIFLKIIPADWFGLFDFKLEPDAKRVVLVDFWESSQRFVESGLRDRMLQYGFDHPFTRYSVEHADPTALKFTDFFSVRELHDTELYQEFYRHAGVDRLLGVASFTESGSATLNLARPTGERDFTERDRLILNLLRPHYERARRNAELRASRASLSERPLADYGLTPREIEVASWLGGGKSNLEIGSIIGMNSGTVEKHIERILVKLGVENRTAAALMIAEAGESRQNGR